MENNGKNSIDLNTPEKIIEVKNLNKFYTHEEFSEFEFALLLME